MTVRKKIIDLLSAGEHSAGDISRAVGIPEKEVYGHLEHIRKTLKGTFKIIPARCLSCGFVFVKRGSVRSPGRCPVCKSEHIRDPSYCSGGAT